MNVLVTSAGFLTSVQDLGRIGFRQSGVSVGGALDSHAIRVANLLVNNEGTAAGLEATMGTVRLCFEDQRIVAWCGGAFTVRIGDHDLPPGHAGLVNRNEELIMTPPRESARAWLAISGGIDVPLVLRSRSTDLRSAFGGYEGRALRDGDVLPLGGSSVSAERATKMFSNRRVVRWTAPSSWVKPIPGPRILRFIRGQHWSSFKPEAQESFVETPFSVTADSDRMGVRLEGANLERMDSADLLSEAVVPGTVQVPPNGRPILLLGDCQTIGGYPRIAEVITVDLPIAAQLWPDNVVHFHEVPLGDAQALLREREEDFARFRTGLSLQF